MKDTRTIKERHDDFIRMYKRSGGFSDDGENLWRKSEIERSATDGSGVSLIAAERFRQLTQEGYTPEHDDTHDRGELALAGASYALGAAEQVRGVIIPEAPTWWQFSPDWWNPADNPVQNLVKAGALISAEIDRLLRGGAHGSREPGGGA